MKCCLAMICRAAKNTCRGTATRYENPVSSGSALIVVLWVLGLLSMFVVAFAFDMHIEARVTSTWRKKLKAEYLAKAGVELARMALFETTDSEINNVDSANYLAKGSDEQLRYAAVALAHGAGAELSREFGAGTVLVSIQPENARMSINAMIHTADRELTYSCWESIFENAGVPSEQWDTLVDCLLDWVDQNESTHLNGVESQYYESLDPPYKAKNRPLETVDELIMIKGFNELIPDSNRTVFDAVADYLTIYSEDQKVNINAVARDVLMAVLIIDAQMADQIIAERVGTDGREGTEDDKPFKDLNDLLSRIPVLSPAVAERISFGATGRFTIQARGKVGDVERVITCVVKQGNKQISILNWFEGPPEDRPITR
ncbi:MAG: general secretion pathway protein GspK [Verrucomicrobia bacterium]|nr:general secretion pathway protein GspK [Verrucomicrobiota bacterium]MCG2679295.1 general secretion pathway protein GspK [Kiritimatiellia bacterium]MBU4247328.1 general secretion pathway protein GspK [Verrucomicrobiota bacterium]MBU4292268.1 general secretion pathway protein GspK [Verrucomicrobiota bacterium]MBU4428288.1 general secretion pathway protein GspK [Verrucomicrobiota bacterium]